MGLNTRPEALFLQNCHPCLSLCPGWGWHGAWRPAEVLLRSTLARLCSRPSWEKQALAFSPCWPCGGLGPGPKSVLPLEPLENCFYCSAHIFLGSVTSKWHTKSLLKAGVLVIHSGIFGSEVAGFWGPAPDSSNNPQEEVDWNV